MAFLAADGAVEAAGPVAVGAVGMGLVAVGAVATPGEALEGGLGGLPVAAAVGGLPAGLGAQQPLRVDLVALAGHHRRRLPAVASAMGAVEAAVAPGRPVGPIGRLGGEPGGRRRRPPVPSHPAKTMLRRPWIIQAVGAPIAVQFRGGRTPHRPLAWVGGDRAEVGQQPARRVQGQGVLVDPPPPGILSRPARSRTRSSWSWASSQPRWRCWARRSSPSRSAAWSACPVVVRNACSASTTRSLATARSRRPPQRPARAATWSAAAW
jgi:hypothetical protein